MLRPATAEDLEPLLALTDSVIAWLVARGRAGQWGADPLSADPGLHSRTADAIAAGTVTVATEFGALVGAVQLDDEVAPYVPAGLVPPDALYIHTLITDRAHRGLGTVLLDHCRQVAGPRPLALDHWAGAPELATLYARAGFAEVGTFTLDQGGAPWPGTVRVRPSDGAVSH